MQPPATRFRPEDENDEPILAEARTNALWHWIHVECPPSVERGLSGVGGTNVVGWLIVLVAIARIIQYDWLAPYVFAAMGVAAALWLAFWIRKWARRRAIGRDGIEVQPDPRTPDGMARAMWLAGLPAREIAVCEYLTLRDRGLTHIQFSLGFVLFFLCAVVWAYADMRLWAFVVLAGAWCATVPFIGAACWAHSRSAFMSSTYAPGVARRARAASPADILERLPGSHGRLPITRRPPRPPELLIAGIVMACLLIAPVRGILFSGPGAVALASLGMIVAGFLIRRTAPKAEERARKEFAAALALAAIVIEWEHTALCTDDDDVDRVLGWRFGAERDPAAPCPEMGREVAATDRHAGHQA